MTMQKIKSLERKYQRAKIANPEFVVRSISYLGGQILDDAGRPLTPEEASLIKIEDEEILQNRGTVFYLVSYA